MTSMKISCDRKNVIFKYVLPKWVLTAIVAFLCIFTLIDKNVGHWAQFVIKSITIRKSDDRQTEIKENFKSRVI